VSSNGAKRKKSNINCQKTRDDDKAEFERKAAREYAGRLVARIEAENESDDAKASEKTALFFVGENVLHFILEQIFDFDQKEGKSSACQDPTIKSDYSGVTDCLQKLYRMLDDQELNSGKEISMDETWSLFVSANETLKTSEAMAMFCSKVEQGGIETLSEILSSNDKNKNDDKSDQDKYCLDFLVKSAECVLTYCRTNFQKLSKTLWRPGFAKSKENRPVFVLVSLLKVSELQLLAELKKIRDESSDLRVEEKVEEIVRKLQENSAETYLDGFSSVTTEERKAEQGSKKDEKNSSFDDAEQGSKKNEKNSSFDDAEQGSKKDKKNSSFDDAEQGSKKDEKNSSFDDAEQGSKKVEKNSSFDDAEQKAKEDDVIAYLCRAISEQVIQAVKAHSGEPDIVQDGAEKEARTEPEKEHDIEDEEKTPSQHFLPDQDEQDSSAEPKKDEKADQTELENEAELRLRRELEVKGEDEMEEEPKVESDGKKTETNETNETNVFEEQRSNENLDTNDRTADSESSIQKLKTSTTTQNCKVTELDQDLEQERKANNDLAKNLDKERHAKDDLAKNLEKERKAKDDLAKDLEKERKAKDDLAKNLEKERRAKDELARNLEKERKAKDELAKNLEKERRAKDELAKNLEKERKAKDELAKNLEKERKSRQESTKNLGKEQKQKSELVLSLESANEENSRLKDLLKKESRSKQELQATLRDREREKKELVEMIEKKEKESSELNWTKNVPKSTQKVTGEIESYKFIRQKKHVTFFNLSSKCFT
jgi:hypothetical protein